MFDHAQPLPPDPILGLAEVVRADPRPDKIDLTAGVYRDDSGITPLFEAVRRAEERLVAEERSKDYLPIAGLPAFTDAVARLVLGSAADELRDRVRAAQTPGGTGALSVAARTTRQIEPEATVWLSDPTWPNHAGVFGQHLAAQRSYRYYDPTRRRADVDALLADLAAVEAGDLVVLHGCCHNPTGADLPLEAWAPIGELLARRGAVAVVDLAYLGLAEGVESDRRFLDELLPQGCDVFVAVSFSKNLSLYRERVGALLAVAPDAGSAANVFDQMKRAIRGNYSNPPSFGAQVTAMVLDDADLRARWSAELAEMRERINGLRAALAEALRARGVGGLEGIEDQRGMFCLTGLDGSQVERLRDEFAVYLVGSGRANVAGLSAATVDRFADALAAVS